MPNSRARGAGDGWANIVPADLQTLDAGLASSVNGDDGGTWAPLTPIALGVAGLVTSVPFVIARGGRITTSSDIGTLAQPTVTIGSGGYPVLDPTNVLRTLPILSSCATARGFPSFAWATRRENGGIQAYAPSYDTGDGLGQRIARAYLRLRAHSAATLSQVTVYFHVAWPHAALPAVMPSVRVMRIDAFGNCQPLTSQAAGADANGYVYVPAPSTPAAWTNQYQQQNLVVRCDQNNVVDLSQYSYVVELVEEQGLTGYPWQLTYTPTALVASTANLSLTGAATIDGVVLHNGDTVLAKDQTDNTTNGLYLVNTGGAWSRWNVLGTAQQFSQGMIVPIAYVGALNSGTFWQVKSTLAYWTVNVPGASPQPGTPLIFVSKPDASFPQEGTGLFPHGILWQSVLANYTNIADLRPY